jgi:hypothetical protein
MHEFKNCTITTRSGEDYEIPEGNYFVSNYADMLCTTIHIDHVQIDVNHNEFARLVSSELVRKQAHK